MMTSLAVPVVTVDGPSGVGKGTISLMLAERLGWHFLDSGALYRVTALAARRQGISFDDETALASVAGSLPVRFEAGADGPRILLSEQDVSHEIRSESCGSDASKVAAVGPVRKALLDRQRAFRRPPGLVADGRDMGNTVFPDASAKIYLTASVAVRAERRYKQLKSKGFSASLGSLLQEIAERDSRDQCRTESPLKPAADAEVIDTSDLDVTAVFERVMAVVKERAGVPL